jgi:Co/Zn/Cd efflux system component
MKAAPHLSWVLSVCVPYLALVGLTLLARGRGEQGAFYAKTLELCLEASILGVGVAAALLASIEARTSSAEGALSVAIVGLLINIIAVGLVTNLKEWEKMKEPGKARLGTALGSLTVAVNTFLLLLVNGYSWKALIILTLIAWVVPILAILLAEYCLSKLAHESRSG